MPFPPRTVSGAFAAAGLGLGVFGLGLGVVGGRESAAVADTLAAAPAGAPPAMGLPAAASPGAAGGRLAPLELRAADAEASTTLPALTALPPPPPQAPAAAAAPDPAADRPFATAPAPDPTALPPAGAPTGDRPDIRAAAVVPGMPLDLDLRADQQGYDAQLRRFVSTGHVTALVAGARLMADRIEIDTDSRTIHAFGSVRFQRGQQYLQASRLRYSLLEGLGEMQDAYGILDLDGSTGDLDLGQAPTAPLPAPEAMTCPPEVPPPPEWHPYPWAVTGWAGQMFAANFGDTFIFKGRLRPEYLTGFGLQRRLINAGPLALELDANLLGHRAAQQPGGPYNQSVPFGDTPAQTFGDLTIGVGGRLWLQPWLNVYFVEGVSLLSQPSNYEKTFRENYSLFLNYLAFEVEALVNPQFSLVGRIHHRSGAYGLYFGVSEGSNAYLLGLRYRLGQTPPLVPPLELPPAQGCPGAPPPSIEGPRGLSEQLQAVTMGQPQLVGTPPSSPGSAAGGSAPRVPSGGDPWSRARQQERLRREAIA
ncbi:MAG: hypothetical protein ACKO0M_00305, partial [Cyanobium sp.]